MAHIRKQVRAQFASILNAGVAAFGGRVTAQRTVPLRAADLPMAVVEIPREDIERRSLPMPGVQNRRMRCSIKVYVRDADAVVDVLDDLCEQVEKTIGATEVTLTLNGKAKVITLIGVSILYGMTGELNWAMAVHEFEVIALTLENDPGTEL
jgi:hypothetical protein